MRPSTRLTGVARNDEGDASSSATKAKQDRVSELVETSSASASASAGTKTNHINAFNLPTYPSCADFPDGLKPGVVCSMAKPTPALQSSSPTLQAAPTKRVLRRTLLHKQEQEQQALPLCDDLPADGLKPGVVCAVSSPKARHKARSLKAATTTSSLTSASSTSATRRELATGLGLVLRPLINKAVEKTNIRKVTDPIAFAVAKPIAHATMGLVYLVFPIGRPAATNPDTVGFLKIASTESSKASNQPRSSKTSPPARTSFTAFLTRQQNKFARNAHKFSNFLQRNAQKLKPSEVAKYSILNSEKEKQRRQRQSKAKAGDASSHVDLFNIFDDAFAKRLADALN